jgi:glyoxylate/hydroxypyruvate reductase A
VQVLVQSSWPTTNRWLDELKRQAPEVTFHLWPDLPEPSTIDAAITWYPPPDLFPRLVNLKAVLSFGAGVDHLLRPEITLPQVPIARLVDPVMTQRMAEYVLYGVLRFHRQFDLYDRQARDAVWERHQHRDPAEIRVGILGFGSMGRAAAALLRGVGYEIAGWSRKAHEIEGATSFAGTEQLEAFLARSDVVVCLLPLTEETRGLLDARRLAQMPPGSFLINAARGEHVVEEDLAAALDSGHLAGALLDVFRTEPLPASSPLWRHPRVTVTPHIASLSNPRTGVAILVEQLRRLERGEELLHLVDPQRGY